LKDILSVKDFAEQSGCSTATIYRKIRNGELKFEIHGGRKFVVSEIKKNPEKLEFFIPEKSDDVLLLKRRIAELENYTKLFENLLEENSKLKEENRELTKRVIKKIDKFEDKNRLIEANQYLISNGFTKKERSKILQDLEESNDSRILKKDGKIYLNILQFSFRDLIAK
jgi:predicted site-specific integrase-resolvase